MTGTIPTDWSELDLGTLAVILDTLRIPLSSVQRAGRSGRYPYCGANGVLDYIDDFRIDDDVILLAEDGGNFDQFAQRPIAYRMRGKIWVNNHAHVLKAANGETSFLFYALEHKDIRPYISSGTRSKLTRSELVRIKVAVPNSRDEQRCIASSIEAVDKHIASLERLITKKQAIKQGMMQELLTGRTRLPGFSKPWRTLRLGDVLTVRHGKSQRTVERPSGVYPILATGGRIGWTDTALYEKPSVLIGRKGTIDRPQYQDSPFWTIDTLFYTEIAPTADPRFLYYVFLGVDWQSLNEASGVPSLSASRVEGISVELPDVDEQRAIRAMLDDSDVEITLLHRRLAKARYIKQGMMQELLTGRTRLPVQEAVA